MGSILIFYLLLFLIAFLYASVGHGGASGYLALMALYGVAPEEMKPTALLLNLFVSMVSFVQYYRGHHFILKIFLPLALASIPMAFLGGLIELDSYIYKKILGLLLFIPVIRFLFFNQHFDGVQKEATTGISIVTGASIGLLSGLIGIGGGIILSPILILLKWTDQKQTAAISALFIFVNSASGLAGQFTKGIHFSANMLVYVLIAFTGGLLGAWLGSIRLRQTVLKNLLALVLFMAAVKLVFFGA